jgi:hypothetical protein
MTQGGLRKENNKRKEYLLNVNTDEDRECKNERKKERKKGISRRRAKNS